jgi:hypothetical protein
MQLFLKKKCHLINIKSPNMKTLLLFLLSTFASIQILYGQCTANFTVTDWCENQYATWTVTNPQPGVKYHWYEPVYAANGITIIDTLDRFYGETGDGTFFVSPYRYTTPTPIPADPNWDARRFWYSIERSVSNFVPSVGNTNNNEPKQLAPFQMDFTAQSTIFINSVKVPVVLYNAADTYSIQISIGTSFSNVFHFSAADAVSLGNQAYLLEVPVNLRILAGSYTMNAVTNPTGGIKTIDGFLWNAENPFSSQTFSVPSVLTATAKQANIWGQNKRSVFFDWNFTSFCNMEWSPTANKTIVGCCTPVIGNVVISASESIIVSGSDNSLLSLSLFSNSSNYFKWYRDGVEIPGGQGIGLTSITVNQAGLYEVREVQNASFISNISCYESGNVLIQERALFAKNNTPKAQYCLGEEIQIEAFGNGVASVDWSLGASVNSPTSKITTVTLDQVGTWNYIVEGEIFADNLVINGDFENGNTGFESNMSYTTGTPNNAQYNINTYVTFQQSYWNAANPSSIAAQMKGDGNFFYADGFNNYNGTTTVWKQTVNVAQNKDYVFSMDHANISWNATVDNLSRVADIDMIFDIYINGSKITEFKTDGNGEYAGVGRWKTDQVSWNSGNNTTAVLEIRQKTQGGLGYDFAIDNILFGGPVTQTAMVTVGPVEDCYEVIVTQTDCIGENRILTASAINSVTGEVVGVIDRWEDSFGNIVGTTNQITITPVNNETYTVYAYFPASNLINNGDFEQGVNGFKYGAINGLYNQGNFQGQFSVLTDPTATSCAGWCVNLGDHTSGTGNMLFVDPANTDGNVIAYDFEGELGKNYLFSLWIANAVNFISNPTGKASSVSFIINGPNATNEIVAEIELERDNDWKELSSVWTPPSNGIYTLTIRTKGDASLIGNGGNDFVLDDIKLATTIDNIYTASIDVEPCVTCEEPLDIVIQSTDADGYICPGLTTTLSTSPNQLNTTDFDFQWFKDGVSSSSFPTGSPILLVDNVNSSSLQINSGEEGTYYIRVRDKNKPGIQSCFKEASIIIRDAVKPTYTITGGGDFCDGDMIDPVVVNFTAGVQPYTITSTGPGAGAKPPISATSFELGTAEGTYALSAISDLYCIGDIAAAQTKTITVYPIPEGTITATNNGKYCGTTSNVNLSITPATGIDLTGATYQWTRGGSPAGASATINAAVAGIYVVTISKNGCTYVSDPFEVIQYDLPTYTIAGGGTYCANETPANIVITFTGTPNFTFDEAVTGAGKTSATTTYTISNPVAGTYRPTNIVDGNGCAAAANAANAVVVINSVPAVPNSPNVSYCVGSASTPLAATGQASAVFTWYTEASPLVGTTTAPTPSTTSDGTQIYWVTQSLLGCESDRREVTVIVNDNLSPTITATPDFDLCANESITLGAAGAFTLRTWSGSAAAHLNSTSLASPVFSGASAGTYTIDLYVEDANGCDGTATATITVYALPTATISPNPAAICNGETSTITATVLPTATGGTGTWTGATKNTETTATFSGTATSTISYSFESAEGCVMTTPASTSVTVNPIPAAPGVADLQYCKDATGIPALSATGTNLLWYTAEFTGTGSATAPTPTTTSAGIQEYWVSQTVAGCESARANITVTILNELTPTITATPGFELCANASITLGITGGTYTSRTWSGTAAAHLNSTSIAAPSFSGASAGTYTLNLLVQDANGCVGTTTETITVHAVPSAVLSAVDQAFCVDVTTPELVTATITPGTLTGTGVWTVAAKQTETTANFIPSAAGVGSHSITYTFTSTFGCVAPQVTLPMTVYALPNVSITPSRVNACESGNNSGVISITPTGTAATGTLVYSSPSGTTINTATGELNPTANVVGTHTIQLDYEDANGCTDVTTTTVEVHALPNVYFGANPTEVCYNSGTLTLVVAPTPGSGTSYSFTGTNGITSANFNPQTASVGANNFMYTFTDNNSCRNSDTYSIDVIAVNPPTVDAPNPKTVVILPPLSVPPLSDDTDLSATKHTPTNFLDWMPGGGGSVLAHDVLTYATGLDENTPEGTYNYAVREGRVIAGGNTCYSDSVIATIIISNCPALTPIVVNPYYCVGTGTPLTATAVAAPGSLGGKISWLSINPVGLTDPNLPEILVDNNTSYTSSISTANPGTQQLYVAEYDATNNCWSVGGQVTIHVVDTPNVTISSPADICTLDEIANITVNPTSGTLSASITNGFSAAARTWTPSGTDLTQTNTFTYVVTQNHGAGSGATTCQSTVTSQTIAHYIAPPTPVNKSWLITKIADIPNDFMVATLTTGTTVNWYGDAAKTQSLATGSVTYTPNRAALQAEVDAITPTPSSYPKTYWITQENAQGCESEPVAITLTLVDCPFDAPSVVGEEKCMNETLNPVSASTPEAVVEWKWYQNDETTPIVNNNATYTHGVSNTLHGTTRFYVSYTAIETQSGDACESPKTAVDVVVNRLPDVSITVPPIACQPAGDIVIPKTETTYNGTGSGVWAVDGAPAGITTAGVFQPNFNGEVTDTYTISYTYTDGKGCVNSAQGDVLVQFTEAPVTQGHLSMTIDNETVEVSVPSPETGATVQWYQTLISTPAVSTDNPYQPSGIPGNVVTNQTRYASQTVNGCESERTVVTIVIVDCPFMAPLTVGEEECQMETLDPISASVPPLTTEPVDEWKWYEADGVTPITNNSDTYVHLVDNTIAATTTFYVSYVATEPISTNQCESPKTAVTVIVNPLPDITIIAPALVCYDQGDEVLEKTVDFHSNGIGSGVWSIVGETGGINSSGVFTPSFKGTVTDTYTVDYTYTDGKGCENNQTHNITVHFTEAPTTVGHTSMIDLNEPVVLTANTLLGAGVKWYAQANGGTSISTDNPWTTPDNPQTEVEKCYWASQTVNGCESTRTTACVSIIDCPVPAPIVNIAGPICNYEDTPEIIAAVHPTWLAPGGRPTPTIAPEFRIYTQATGGTAIETNTTGVYEPIINKTTTGTHRFWVSEYNGNVTPQGCEGPRTAVVLDVYRTASVLVNSVDPICDGELNRRFTVTGKIGDIEWHVGSTPPAHPALTGAVALGENFTPSSAQIQGVGTHSVYAVHKVNGCVSEPAEGTIEIKAIPDAPSVTGNEICAGAANLQICATPSTGGTVSWFQTTSSTTPLRVASCYTPTVTAVQTHTFYALQEVNGCKSVRVPVQYEIKRNPLAPTITVLPTQVCENGGENPIFTAEGEPGSTIKWYRTDGTPLPDGATYTHVISGAGRFTYEANQVVNGCPGNKRQEQVQVIATPNPPTISSKYMCDYFGLDGKPEIPEFTSNNDRTYWYKDSDADIDDFLLSSRRNFKPTPEQINQTTTKFYARSTDANGLCFSDTVSFTMNVTEKPSFTIGENIDECFNEEIKTIEATDFKYGYGARDKVLWEIERNNLRQPYRDNALSITPSDKITGVGTYTIYAQYSYTQPNGVACYSDYESISYTVRGLPRTPIVPVVNATCKGSDIAPIQAFGSPFMKWTALQSTPAESFGNTYVFEQPHSQWDEGLYDFVVYDYRKYTNQQGSDFWCESLPGNITMRIAPAAEPKITGKELVCVGEMEVRYATGYTFASYYDWKITRNQRMYKRDDNVNLNHVRFVDWSEPGYDTISVYEETQYGCIGFDTLVVKTAPYPKPSYEWSLPGASNIVAYQNTTVQDSIWAIRADGTMVSEEIEYTLYWNFGKYPKELNHVDEIVLYNKVNQLIEEGGYKYGPWDATLTAINAFGCEAKYTEQVFVDALWRLWVPNAFAPLDPAHGVRYFQPKAFNLESMEIWVFDTWGNIVWYSNEVDEAGNFIGKWDGTYNGIPLKSDTYIWKIEAIGVDGLPWNGIPNGKGGYNKYGNLILLR